MILKGRDPHDEDWWDEASEYEHDAAQAEYEQKLVHEALKEILRELGAKTGAQHRLRKQERAKACQQAADQIWAKHPSFSKKHVALALERADKQKFGSANTIRIIIKKPPAK